MERKIINIFGKENINEELINEMTNAIKNYSLSDIQKTIINYAPEKEICVEMAFKGDLSIITTKDNLFLDSWEEGNVGDGDFRWSKVSLKGEFDSDFSVYIDGTKEEYKNFIEEFERNGIYDKSIDTFTSGI